MTKEEVVALGIEAQAKRDFFNALGFANQETDPEKRLAQIEQYERARADMHEAQNMHHSALEKLGIDD